MRKELLPRPRSDRDAVGDRVAEQIIQRTGLRICGEPGILEGKSPHPTMAASEPDGMKYFRGELDRGTIEQLSMKAE